MSTSWASLPLDLLSTIATLLYAPDYARFRSVCASWRSAAAAAAASPLAPLMPFLLSSSDLTGSSSLLNLADARIQRLAPLPDLAGAWLVGSQHGWLVALDPLSNLSLINPLTRSQIHLPSITTLPFIEAIFDPADGSLSKYRFHRDRIWDSIPDAVVDYTPDAFRRLSFRKVSLSSPPTEGLRTFAVAAIFHMWKLMVFLRPGEDKWRLIDNKEWFDNIIFRGGSNDSEKVVAAAVSETHGEVFFLDLSCDPPAKTVLPRVLEDGESFSARYLVDLDGDLLQICRDTVFVEERNMYVLQSFLILRWDTKQETWCRLTSLDQHSLFVGNCYSIALSARDIPGLKPNCIYFTDDAWEEFYLDDEVMEMVRDVGVYNVEDESVELLDCHGIQLKWPPPVWFTPNLRKQN